MTTEIPPLPADWRERIAKFWYGLKMADSAIQLEKDGRRQLVAEHAVRAAYRVAGGKELPEFPAGLEEDMSVNVGDQIHYHHAAPQPAGLSPLGKLGVAAALATGGAGAGVVASQWLSQPPAAVAPAEPSVAPAFDPSLYEFGIETK